MNLINASGALVLAASVSAVSLGVAAGPVFWRLSGESVATIGAAEAADALETPRLDLSPILVFAPFGSPTGPEAAPQVVGETSLGLTLLGVTIAEPVANSRAIIAGGDGGGILGGADGSGRAESYAVGAQITANATLAEVTRDYVVLSVDGRLETLSFSKPGAVAAAADGGDLRSLIPSNGDPDQAPVSNDADAVIARYRAAILQNPQSVMDRLGLEATAEGYRISEAASPGVRQAGFRPGDLVTTVNGRKVGDVPSDQRYFDEIAASGKARVEVQRDGQTIMMSFPLR